MIDRTEFEKERQTLSNMIHVIDKIKDTTTYDEDTIKRLCKDEGVSYQIFLDMQKAVKGESYESNYARVFNELKKTYNIDSDNAGDAEDAINFLLEYINVSNTCKSIFRDYYGLGTPKLSVKELMKKYERSHTTIYANKNKCFRYIGRAAISNKIFKLSPSEYDEIYTVENEYDENTIVDTLKSLEVYKTLFEANKINVREYNILYRGIVVTKRTMKAEEPYAPITLFDVIMIDPDLGLDRLRNCGKHSADNIRKAISNFLNDIKCPYDWAGLREWIIDHVDRTEVSYNKDYEARYNSYISKPYLSYEDIKDFIQSDMIRYTVENEITSIWIGKEVELIPGGQYAKIAGFNADYTVNTMDLLCKSSEYDMAPFNFKSDSNNFKQNQYSKSDIRDIITSDEYMNTVVGTELLSNVEPIHVFTYEDGKMRVFEDSAKLLSIAEITGSSNAMNHPILNVSIARELLPPEDEGTQYDLFKHEHYRYMLGSNDEYVWTRTTYSDGSDNTMWVKMPESFMAEPKFAGCGVYNKMSVYTIIRFGM